jgi:hypothetical protein
MVYSWLFVSKYARDLVSFKFATIRSFLLVLYNPLFLLVLYNPVVSHCPEDNPIFLLHPLYSRLLDLNNSASLLSPYNYLMPLNRTKIVLFIILFNHVCSLRPYRALGTVKSCLSFWSCQTSFVLLIVAKHVSALLILAKPAKPMILSDLLCPVDPV